MASTKANPKTRAARVAIVDDHPAVREALAIRVSQVPDLEICGEADDVPGALDMIARTDPDVVIIDISLKNGDGLDLIKRIVARNSKVRLLVWSMHSEDHYAERALRAGAVGYITKEQATGCIVEAIREVLGGKVYLSRRMTEKMLQYSIKGKSLPSGSAVDTLSDRELEVFRMIGNGIRTQEIARRLHLSPKTVETYRDRIREKLKLSDGAALTRAAVQWVLENV